MLVGAVAARCRELIEGKCAEKGWHCLALAVQPDHIHVFVRVWPSESAAEVVKVVKECKEECKGITAVTLRREVPPLLTLPSMWTRSDFASTAGKVSQETMQRSIAAQRRR